MKLRGWSFEARDEAAEVGPRILSSARSVSSSKKIKGGGVQVPLLKMCGVEDLGGLVPVHCVSQDAPA
eukprot:6923627-Pyramimonas_sp.AAC.1